MKHIILLTLSLFIKSSFASLVISGTQQHIVNERLKAIYRIEIYKTPIDPLTERRQIGGNMSDEKIATLAGFHIGKGYILTAAHAFDEFKKAFKSNNHLHGYKIKIIDHQNRLIPDIQLGKCGDALENSMPDVCILKATLYEKSYFELPKEADIDPSESVNLGIINKSSHYSNINQLIEGRFQESFTHKDGINQNVKLWVTTLKTDIGNSGSPVFDTDTGKILGMTTNSIKLEGVTRAEVIPIQFIRKYLNKKDWESKSIPSHMQSYGAILLKKKITGSK